ncbi:MAG: hypothetical protein H6Q00_3069 [Holophagaceae bacterium]|nr:hypothetical protein [Holophagaceae bacterium]
MDPGGRLEVGCAEIRQFQWSLRIQAQLAVQELHGPLVVGIGLEVFRDNGQVFAFGPQTVKFGSGLGFQLGFHIREELLGGLEAGLNYLQFRLTDQHVDVGPGHAMEGVQL